MTAVDQVEPDDQFVWHLTIEKYGTEREFTFVSVEMFDHAYIAAVAFLGKRYPNKFKEDERFAGDGHGNQHVRECPHDPEMFITGLKRGHQLSSTEESQW